MSNGGQRHDFWNELEIVFDTIGSKLYSWLWKFEEWTIIPLVEGSVRLWYHLDPRVYSERRRIKRISEGKVAQKSNRYVIFVLYTKMRPPNFTANIIEAIDRSPLNLVIVSNGELDPDIRTALLDKCHLLIERINLGRDFGAYKDGISIVEQWTKNIERLILINDSMFFFERGLDKLVSDLDGTEEFIGLTEVFEFHYHVQSFMLSFGPYAIKSRAFHEFWQKYRPISTRRWAIHNGEVGLSRVITKAGFSPHILFQAAQLLPHLLAHPNREALQAIRYFPTRDRRHLYRMFNRVIGSENMSISQLETISEGLRPTSPCSAKGGEGRTLEIAAELDALDRWNFETFAKRIVRTIATHNQVHLGGFLFMKYLGMPTVKRDIFYRQLYSLEEVHRYLSEFNEPLRDEVISDLRRGGTSKHLKGFWKLLYRHGSI